MSALLQGAVQKAVQITWAWQVTLEDALRESLRLTDLVRLVFEWMHESSVIYWLEAELFDLYRRNPVDAPDMSRAISLSSQPVLAKLRTLLANQGCDNPDLIKSWFTLWYDGCNRLNCSERRCCCNNPLTSAILAQYVP